MKVYLDKNNICHAEQREDYREAEHKYFDNIAPDALPFYRFIPEKNFIQCFNDTLADSLQRNYELTDMQRAMAILGIPEERQNGEV